MTAQSGEAECAVDMAVGQGGMRHGSPDLRRGAAAPQYGSPEHSRGSQGSGRVHETTVPSTDSMTKGQGGSPRINHSPAVSRSRPKMSSCSPLEPDREIRGMDGGYGGTEGSLLGYGAAFGGDKAGENSGTIMPSSDRHW